MVVEQFAVLKKIPGFARCPASSLLGMGAGRAPLIRRLGCMHEVDEGGIYALICRLLELRGLYPELSRATGLYWIMR